MNKIPSIIIIVLAVSFTSQQNVHAQIPRTISFQGVLADAQGNLVPDGNHQLKIVLYDQATSGNQVFVENQTIPVVKGIFNVIIGSMAVIPQSLNFDRAYFLGVSVDGGNELTPRSALTSVPYALRAERANIAESLSPNAAVVTHVNNQSGDVTLFGAGGTTVTNNGNAFTISSTGTGGTGIQGVQNTNNTLDITNGTGPTATINVRNQGITSTQLADNAVTNANLTDNAVNGAKIASGQVVKSINSLRDDVTLTAGTNVTITPSGNRLTIATTGGSGGLSAVAHNGTLSGNGTSGNPLSLIRPLSPGVATAEIADNAVTGAKIPTGQVVKSINTISDDVMLAAGANVTITPSGGTLTIAATDGGGTITGVTAGTGLIGGGTSGNVTLNVAVPLYLTGSIPSPGAIITGNNNGIGNGVYGSSTSGYALIGSTGTGTGVGGFSTDGKGVYGYSVSSTGVFGSSTSGRGMWGQSSSSDGVLGESSSSFGVRGSSGSGRGVFGESSSDDGVGGLSHTSGKSGVWGVNDNGTGVKGNGGIVGMYGISSSGRGVSGESYSNDGVYGTSTSGTGVNGYTSNGSFGVFGQSEKVNGNGVRGFANVGSSAVGVYGSSTSGYGVSGSSVSGYGVYGGSSSGRGVLGESSSNDGVAGFSTTSGKSGVWGNNDNGYGVAGSSSSNYGVYGTSTSGDGVYGSSTSGIAMHGSSTSGIAMYCSGKFYQGTGIFEAHPTSTTWTTNKPATVKLDNGTKVKLFTEESTEIYFMDYGEGQLMNGKTHIELDPTFLQTVTIDKIHPLKAFVQLTDDCKGIFIANRTSTGFDVVEMQSGISNASFFYRVVCKRKYYEDERLATEEEDIRYNTNVLNTVWPEVSANAKAERMKMEKMTSEHAVK